jgi:hypothetical protein
VPYAPLAHLKLVKISEISVKTFGLCVFVLIQNWLALFPAADIGRWMHDATGMVFLTTRT